MSIQAFLQNFNPRNPIVDPKTGIPTESYGLSLLLALWNRTGKGTGIIPQVTPQASLLTATGSTQGDAFSVTQDWNWFGTVPVGSGAIILPLKPGNDIQFYNGASANALKIYPPSGSQIDALGVNNPFSLAAGKLRVFECWSITEVISGVTTPGQFLSYGN